MSPSLHNGAFVTGRLEVVARKSRGASQHSPLLFVHGAAHGAWCWAERQPLPDARPHRPGVPAAPLQSPDPGPR